MAKCKVLTRSAVKGLIVDTLVPRSIGVLWIIRQTGSSGSLYAVDNTANLHKTRYCFSLEGRTPANRKHRQVLCSCNLDLYPMTLITYTSLT